MINDILDFSKIDSGKLDLNVSDMDVAHCLEQAIDLDPRFAAAYADMGVALSLRYEGGRLVQAATIRAELAKAVPFFAGLATKELPVNGVRFELPTV